MKRILLINNQLKAKSNFVSPYNLLSFDDFLTNEEIEYRDRFKEYLQEKISPKIPQYYEKQEFPLDFLKDMLKEFPGIFALSNQGYGSANISHWLSAVLVMEIAKVDLSLCTFFMVHGAEVVMKTLYLLGSEEQKNKYLPRLNSLELIGSFCLTEPQFGSDAYSIETNVTEDGDHYVINGKKRWIGNAIHAGLFIVWAKDKNNEINGYLVEKSDNVIVKRIEGKMCLRIVQNCDIEFKNVRISKENKLLGKNFKETVSQVFLSSRIGIGWGAIGAMMGSYETIINYLSNRIQFGKPLTSFQLVQEKLVRIMGNIQSCLYLVKRITDLYIKGQANMGLAALCKSFCSSKGREAVALARELMGGNGIILDNYVMKAFVDMESVHTFEGTWDINVLLAGKELTGRQALF
jgi:alkylation response protein AidB-like acyl-CoA dehydrogenase